MIEVAPRLYVGSADDYESLVRGRDGWAVVHACKEPYHRRLLGYTGRSAPEGPERLVAVRGDELYLNLVDAPSVEYINREAIWTAFAFTTHHLFKKGHSVLIHCNQGRSRAPAIALITLACTGYFVSTGTDAIIAEFTDLYPPYQPGAGIAAFVASVVGEKAA